MFLTMKKLAVFLVAVAVSMTAFADAPQGYYRSLDGKKEGELKTAIHKLIRNFTLISSYQALPDYFRHTDVRPSGDEWWEMYSNNHFNYPSFSGMNREHSFPKSWWGGDQDVSAYVDLNHLYPSEYKANSAKSNHPLGEVDRSTSVKFDNGVSTVGYPITGQGGGSQYVYEPDDEYKGDFARTYFYMVTCYQDLTWNTKYSFMMSQNTYPTLQGWAAKMLLKWAKEDPVSEKETRRNDVVYSYQNNRNPFIDIPELADYLWGDKVGQVFHLNSSSEEPAGDPELFTPTQGMEIDFGEIAIGESVSSGLFFRGENLSGSFDLVLFGSDKTQFSIPTNSLSTSLVNAENGTWLQITYKPTELGTHTAKLIISEGGILGGSRGVVLKGTCLEVPNLSACTATAATDITANSYTANWTYPENEAIDYWIVTRTQYIGSTVTTEEIIAEAPGLTIEGFNESDSEAYMVQSVRLGYRSPESNVIFVDHSGITGIEADQGLIVQGFDGCIRFVCSAPQTNAQIIDPTGRLIQLVGEIHNNMEINLPKGIYFVTTDNCRRPVKVVVR